MLSELEGFKFIQNVVLGWPLYEDVKFTSADIIEKETFQKPKLL